MSKYIILTGKFGMGHYRIAEAIREKIIKNENDSAIIVDWVELQRPMESNFIYKTYNIISKHMIACYNMKYEGMEDGHTNQRPSMLLGKVQPLKKLIEKEKPDKIIATLAMCAQVVSEYKEQYNSNIPLISCITDITAHSEWINDGTDLYIVGSEEVKNQLVKKGVNSKNIRITGVPVSNRFIQRKSTLSKGKNKAKNILIMGGGFGIMPKSESFYQRLNSIDNANIIIITGTNYKLKDKLQNNYKNITTLGFIEDMEKYYNWADYVVTKPGGSTMFEAIASEVPILALKPKFCQERHNADFIIEKGIGDVLSGTERDIISKIELITEDEQIWQNMHSNIVKFKRNIDLELSVIEEIKTPYIGEYGRLEELTFEIA